MKDLPMSEEVVRRRKPHKKRQKPKALFYLPNILIGVALLLILAYILCIMVFRTTSVEVSGNHILSDQEIESQVVTGKYTKYGLVQVVKRIFKPVKDLPFCESCKVSVSLTSPHTLKIKIKEPTLLGYISLSDGKRAYFNDDGIVEEVSDRQVDGLLPVNGISCSKAEKGELLPINKSCRRTLLQLVKAMKKYGIKTDSVTFKDDREVSAVSGDITYDFGTFDYMQEKLMRLPYLLPHLTGLKGTLHLDTWTPENTDIIFEKSEG